VKINTKSCSWKRNTSSAWKRHSINTMKFSRNAARWSFRKKYTKISWRSCRLMFNRKNNDLSEKTKCWRNYIETRIPPLSLVSACRAMHHVNIFPLCLLQRTKRQNKSESCVKITQVINWKHQMCISRTQLVNTRVKGYQNITKKAVHFLRRISNKKFIELTRRLNK
jgi:hypothetical protein